MITRSIPLLIILLLFSCDHHHHTDMGHYGFRSSGTPIPGAYGMKGTNENRTRDSFSNTKTIFFQILKANRITKVNNVTAVIPGPLLQKAGHKTSEPKISASGDPGVSKQQIEDDIDDARLLIILGVILPYCMPAGLIMLSRAKRKMRDSNIQDPDLDRRFRNLTILAIVLIILKVALSVYLTYLFFTVVLDALFSNVACYIATMVYGSYDAAEVLVLRKFRDEKLKQYVLGQLFIGVYYAFSPMFVRIFRNVKPVNTFCRWVLDRMVKKLEPSIA